MKRIHILWVLLILVISNFGSYYLGQKDYRDSLRNQAWVENSELLSMDSLHRAEADYYKREANNESEARQQTDAEHARLLAKLRSQPVQYVEVPVVKVAECDSAIASGRGFQREVGALKMQLRSLSTVVHTGDSLRLIDQMNLLAQSQIIRDKNDTIQTLSGQLETETINKKGMANSYHFSYRYAYHFNNPLTWRGQLTDFLAMKIKGF